MSTNPPRTTPRPRVLSGMRPTGRLHLGNYMGALYNWVHLQQDYDCYFFIADLHALTTDYADPGDVQANNIEIALDFLAAGLDPGRCVIFKQSDVPAHSELFLLFSMFTPLGWLERVPTYKDQQEQLREKDLATYGFLGYPLLQAADILLYKPDFVPVGADQVAHVELTREVARRFNSLYPGEFFTSPEAAPWEMAAILEKARKLAGEPQSSTRTDFSPRQLFEAASQTKKISPFGRLEILPEPQVLLTPIAQTPRPRRPQDVQELQEPHRALRVRRRAFAPSSRPWSPTPRASAATTPATPTSAPSSTSTKSSAPRPCRQKPPQAVAPPASAASNARAG